MTTTRQLPRWPQLTDDDIEAAVAALRSNRLVGGPGSGVEELEGAVARAQGVAHAVAVSSGTAAVHLALHVLGVGPGDEVIVPAHTFVGTAAPVVHLGARPVFAAPTADRHNLDPGSVKALITERTRAIVAVHLNGCAADLDALIAVADDAGVPLVEDMAQALGTEIGGRPVGGFGRLSCISLFEQKVVTSAGEGGLVLTDDAALADRVRRLRTHGEGPIEGRPGLIWAHEVGYNFRLTTVQAAVGASQFTRLPSMLAGRRDNAAHLTRRLTGTPGLARPVEPPGPGHAFWKYVVRVVPGAGVPPAAEVAAALRARGVPVLLRYPFPLHRLPAFAAHWDADRDPGCPVADRLSDELIALPSHPGMDAADLDHVAEQLQAVLAERS